MIDIFCSVQPTSQRNFLSFQRITSSYSKCCRLKTLVVHGFTFKGNATDTERKKISQSRLFICRDYKRGSGVNRPDFV